MIENLTIIRKSKRNNSYHKVFLGAYVLMSMAGSVPQAEAQSSYQVRVTTGSVTVRGWETNLIKGNPNLAHFTWMPITSYTQGNATYRTGRGASLAASMPARARNIYIKPVHVATAIPKRMLTPLRRKVSRQSNVIGRLIHHDKVRPSAPQIATYGSLHLLRDATNTNASLEHTEVRGSILRSY